MSNICQALHKLREHGALREVHLPELTDVDVAKLEQSLGCRLPPSYCQFLKEGNQFGLTFEEFLWIGGDRDIVEANRARHSEEGGIHLPKYLISFLQDGYGNDLCFDTRYTFEDGEYPIVEWQLGMMEDEIDTEEIEPIAKDFPTWLIETLEDEVEQRSQIENSTGR